MTASLFLALLVVVATGIGLATWRWLPRGDFWVVAIGLSLWLAYVGTLSSSGLIRSTTLRPPGIVWIFVPVLVFLVFFAVRSRRAAALSLALPLWVLTTAQVFRVGVEIGLHRLGVEGLVPRLMTLQGGNVDIAIGLTAPFVAWLCAKGRLGAPLVAGWNWLGLLALGNVIVRAVLTAPGPLQMIHAGVPNRAIGMFPYTYIAGFFAPLAVLLHVLSLRALRQGAGAQRPRAAALAD